MQRIHELKFYIVVKQEWSHLGETYKWIDGLNFDHLFWVRWKNIRYIFFSFAFKKEHKKLKQNDHIYVE